MGIVFKSAGCILISVILCSMIPKERKELSLLLSIAVCCMVCIGALNYLTPMFSFMERLKTLGQLNPNTFNTVMKVVGVSLIAEISALTCKDVGNGAMGKSLQFMATVVILWLALPLFEELISLIESVLGAA